jgi:hypothetical protein
MSLEMFGPVSVAQIKNSSFSAEEVLLISHSCSILDCPHTKLLKSLKLLLHGLEPVLGSIPASL